MIKKPVHFSVVGSEHEYVPQYDLKFKIALCHLHTPLSRPMPFTLGHVFTFSLR